MKASRYNKVLGLALGERSMHLAEVTSAADKPEARLMAEFEYPAGTSLQEPAALGAALAAFLREKHFSARQAVVGLPARWLLVKSKEVPPADSKTASDLLRLQAEGEFSSELRDLVFDYAGEADAGKAQTVMLVATPRKYIELAEALCDAAKLSPIAVTSSAAALGAVTSRVPATSNAVVLAIAPGGAELSAQSGGHPTSLRHLRSPGPGGQEVLFLSELRRAVSMLPANGTAVGREMIVWDGTEADPATFGQNLGLPVKFGDLPSLGVRTVDATRNGAGRKFGATVALGVSALGDARFPIDFLHSRLAAVPVRPVKPWMIWSGLAAVLVIGLAVFGYLTLQHQRTELSTLTTNYTAKEPHIKTATAFVSKVSFAERWEAGDPRYVACLASLTAVMPEDGQTYVTSLSIKEKEIRPDAAQKAAQAGKPAPVPGLLVTLSGNAPSQVKAQEMYNSFLRHPEWFADVSLPRVIDPQPSAGTGRGRSGGGGTGTNESNFTLTCTFRLAVGGKTNATTRPAGSGKPGSATLGGLSSK